MSQTYTILDGTGASQTVTVPTLGQQVSASSTPVVIASDQTAVPVSASASSPIYIADAYLAAQNATWTSATAANTAVSTTCLGYDGVMVSLKGSGTITGGHVTFEVYDGAAWLPIKGFALESYNGYSGYPLSGSLNNGLQFDFAGCTQFRVRLDTQITGSGSMGISLNVTSAPMVPGMSVGLDPASSLPTGTNVIGQVTANAGTNLNTSSLALETGGNLAGINTKITTTANGIKVDGSAVTQPISGTVTANAGTGTFAISAASLPALSGTTAVSLASVPLPTGASTSANQPTNAAAASTTSGQTGTLHLGAVTTSAPAYTTATSNYLSLTTLGGLRHDISSYNGTALTGTVTAYGTAPTGNVFGVNAYITNTPAVTITSGTVTTVSTVTAVTNITNGTPISPSATIGGFTTYSTLIAAATTNATLVKASSGNIGVINVFNAAASVRYLKLFNKATAPVPGTDTPILNIPIGAGQSVTISNPAGIKFATGIGFALTGGSALLDATACTAGDVILNIAYI